MNSSELYKQAYDLHYVTNDLSYAMELYQRIIQEFPESKEAQYASMQVSNIQSVIESKGKNVLASPEAKSDTVILTTADRLPNNASYDLLEIISAECVFGLNLFKDFFMGTRDFFGGRSKSAQDALRDARRMCLEELKRESQRVGGNAVISVRLDYSEISGQGKGMLFLVATGTAVRYMLLENEHEEKAV